MSTLSSIFIMFCIFTIYKFEKFKNWKGIEKDKKNNIIKEITLNRKFYSTLSFNFPNIQPERELKDIDLVSGFSEKPSEIKIQQYCKY